MGAHTSLAQEMFPLKSAASNIWNPPESDKMTTTQRVKMDKGVTRMTGPKCAVMCNFMNKATHTHKQRHPTVSGIE